MLKQQLESQIALLKEQIHSAHMNDEHYDQRSKAIETEVYGRERSLSRKEKLLIDLFDLLLDPGRFQKEHVDVIQLQLFPQWDHGDRRAQRKR